MSMLTVFGGDWASIAYACVQKVDVRNSARFLLSGGYRWYTATYGASTHYHIDGVYTMINAQGKRSAALASVGSGILLTVLKLIVGFATGSLGILAEAAHSALDLVAAAVTFGVVHVAEQPPDENHPYGHARAENLGALAETVLLVVTALWVLWHAYERIFVHVELPVVTFWSFLVMVISLGVDWTRSRALKRAAETYHSQALAADAAHFANDMLGTGVVIIALGVLEVSRRTTLIPSWIAERADAVAAVIVALIALYVSWTLGRRAIHALMDDVPHDLNTRLTERVEQLPNVLSNSVRVRSRFVGEQPYVDVSFKVPRGRSLDETQLISDAAREAVRQELPDADVVVNVDPARTEREGYATAVYAAANRLGQSVHNLDVFQLQQGLHVNFDLEVPSHWTLAQAHATSEDLSAALADELPAGVQINVHLEPRRDDPQPAVHFPQVQAEIEAALHAIPESNNVTRIESFLIESGVVVTLACAYPSTLPLTDVHKSMASLERALRHSVPTIVRVQLDPEIAAPVETRPSQRLSRHREAAADNSSRSSAGQDR